MKRKICSAAIVAAILVSLISSISPVYAVSDEAGLDDDSVALLASMVEKLKDKE